MNEIDGEWRGGGRGAGHEEQGLLKISYDVVSERVIKPCIKVTTDS